MNYTLEEKNCFMNEAIKEAKKASAIGEVPVGAVIVKQGKIIARGYNKKETKKNPILHAEIVAINKACKKLHNFRLENTELFVTIEPCLMCSGAIVAARIPKIYFGARDEKYGAVVSVFNAFDIKSNHKVEFEEGINSKECGNIIKRFFKEIRKNPKK